jgi:hypothetical protein
MAIPRVQRRIAVIGAALLGMGLVQIAGGSAASAVGGPAAVDPALGFNVKVQVGETVRACSGVLLNNWWVATATSCFADGSGTAITAGAPPVATTVTIGRLDLTKTDGYVRRVDKIVPHPDRDLVLARLADAAFGATSVKVGTTAPATGDSLIATGYGRTADTWVPDALHTGDFKVTSVGSGVFDVTAVTDATICLGDAGGPILRRTATGYELVGLHYRSWQGGCLAESSTRHDATETRVDDIASWITANSAIPRALQESITDTRIGVLRGDYGAQVKEGGLSAAWTALLANAKAIVVADDRIGVLTNDGVAYVKEGATTAAFVQEYTGVKQLAVSGNRIGVLTDAGVALVKEGGLSTAWVTENTGVQQVEVTDTRVGVLTDAGVALVKEGGLSTAWVTENTGVKQLALFGTRIGVLTTAGAALVKDGGLSAAWSSQVASGAAELMIKDDRIGVLTTDKVALVKEGALTATFVTEYTNVRDLSISGNRVGVVTVDGAALTKEGGLSAAWVTEW